MIVYATSKIPIKWNSANKSRLESLGYNYTKMREVVFISPDHLTQGSTFKVEVYCPECWDKRNAYIYNLYKVGNSLCNSCAKELNKKDLTGQRFGRLTVTRESNQIGKRRMWSCVCDCGNTLEVRDDSLERGNTKSCGCLNVDILKSMSGENSPTWNPLLTDKQRKENESRFSDAEIRKWRKRVLVRDQNRCVICLVSEKLNVHHIYSYANYPLMRTDDNNGITLCENHHSDFHSKHGYGYNDGWQFLDYISKYRVSPNLQVNV